MDSLPPTTGSSGISASILEQPRSATRLENGPSPGMDRLDALEPAGIAHSTRRKPAGFTPAGEW
ncbi:hypothetical protein ACFQMM_07985 [Saliphagus sp. GCM10025308]